jgi:hypothetical protein
VNEHYSAVVSDRIASRKLARSLRYLHWAEQQMTSASNSALNRYHRNHLRSLADGLRDLSLPLMRIVSRLERGR